MNSRLMGRPEAAKKRGAAGREGAPTHKNERGLGRPGCANPEHHRCKQGRRSPLFCNFCASAISIMLSRLCNYMPYADLRYESVCRHGQDKYHLFSFAYPCGRSRAAEDEPVGCTHLTPTPATDTSVIGRFLLRSHSISWKPDSLDVCT